MGFHFRSHAASIQAGNHHFGLALWPWRIKPSPSLVLSFLYLQNERAGPEVLEVPFYLQQLMILWLLPLAKAVLISCTQTDSVTLWEDTNLAQRPHPRQFSAGSSHMTVIKRRHCWRGMELTVGDLLSVSGRSVWKQWHLPREKGQCPVAATVLRGREGDCHPPNTSQAKEWVPSAMAG